MTVEQSSNNSPPCKASISYVSVTHYCSEIQWQTQRTIETLKFNRHHQFVLLTVRVVEKQRGVKGVLQYEAQRAED